MALSEAAMDSWDIMFGNDNPTPIKAFCTVENAEGCSDYIDQALGTFGMAPVEAFGATKSPEHAVSIVNCLYKLIELHRDDMAKLEQSDVRHRKINTELFDLRSAHDRLKEAQVELERETAEFQEKARKVSMRNKNLTNELKATQDELRRLKSDTQRRNSQYHHELKKKDVELEKLKQRMVKLLQDKTRDRVTDLELANNVQRIGGRRGQWANSERFGPLGMSRSYRLTRLDRAEEDLHRAVVANYEEKQKELMSENESLRSSLALLERDLLGLLRAVERKGTDAASASNALLDGTHEIGAGGAGLDIIPEEQFEMPFALAGEEITHSLQSKIGAIKAQFSELQSTKHDSAAVALLQEQIKEYQDLLLRQEQALLEDGEDNFPQGDKSFLSDSRLISETELLHRDRQQLDFERKRLYEEREQFTKGVIKLAKERAALERERACFDLSQLDAIDVSFSSPARADNFGLRPPLSAAGISTPRIAEGLSARLLSSPKRTGSSPQLMRGPPARLST
eukprot:m.63533 g.63533  ORF g.63533 m.63533 type:complete len:512 (+) comp7463_c0_seq1:103-1638(+)